MNLTKFQLREMIREELLKEKVLQFSKKGERFIKRDIQDLKSHIKNLEKGVQRNDGNIVRDAIDDITETTTWVNKNLKKYFARIVGNY